MTTLSSLLHSFRTDNPHGVTKIQLGLDNLPNAVTGTEPRLVTGLAGSGGNLLTWNAQGDAIDAGVAPDAFVAESTLNVHADTYDAVGGMDVTAGAVVALDTTRTMSATNFALSGGVLTYNAGTDLFVINAQVSTDVSVGTGRSVSRAKLQISTDGGAVWGDVSGSFGWMYNRIDGNGEGTCSISVILTLNSGDKLRLWTERLTGADTIVTLANGSRLALWNARGGSGGPTGLTGPAGADGLGGETWTPGNLGVVSTNQTLDLAAANLFTLEPTANLTLDFTNLADGAGGLRGALIVITGGGDHTLSFTLNGGGTVGWVGGAAPSLATGTSRDTLSLYPISSSEIRLMLSDEAF